MSIKKLSIESGTIKELLLPNRGSRGLQLVYEIAGDAKVIEVTREDLTEEDVIRLELKPGDSYPAYFKIKGLEAGSCKLIFTERRVGMPEGQNLPVQEFEIEVK